MILHCMKKATWESVKDRKYCGEKNLEMDGFIHCSPVEYFWRVAPNFRNIEEDLVLLCLDVDRLESPIKWEEGEPGGKRYYPHIYGLINLDAVIQTLPYLKDKDGNWLKNKELEPFQNK
ncbi:MAG TPA: DUF952 domain-containing protein [Clostridia bacterium]|nr:DUF952 domain-containing protein [Clostridia bacterium]